MHTIHINNRQHLSTPVRKAPGMVVWILIIGLFFAFPRTASSSKSNAGSGLQHSYSVNEFEQAGREDFYPEFSPDGKHIVFSSKPIDGNDFTDLHLWIMDQDGKNRREVLTANGMDLFPSFSPDGKKIVFVSNRDDGLWNIWSVHVDGSNLTRLTTMRGKEFSPFVTPDGKNIIFVTEASGTGSVWTMGIDGSNPRRLTSGGNGDHYPSMGPDKDKEIIFASTRVGMGDVWSIDIDNNIYKRLTYKNVMEGAPSVNSNGTKIAYIAKDGGEYDDFATFESEGFDFKYNVKKNAKKFLNQKEGVFDIWVMDTDGKHKKRLTKNISGGDFETRRWGSRLYQIVSYYHLSWHPEGEKIALTTWEPGVKGSNISVVEFDKETIDQGGKNDELPEFTLTGEIELTSGDWDDFGPCFSPDGGSIIFTSNKSGNWDIWSIGPNGENLTQLSKGSGDELAPVFSPDGKEIAYLYGKSDNSQDKETLPSYDIRIMKSNGKQASRLTNNIPVVSYPAWNPNGNEIAFVSKGTKGAEIWIYNISDQTQKKIRTFWDFSKKSANRKKQTEENSHPLSKNAVGGFGYPFEEFLYRVDYNSTGDRITFESNSSGTVQIVTMDLNGGNLKQVTEGDAPHWNPVFSPDGKKIAYSSERPAPQMYPPVWPDYNIWIADVETNQKMVLTGEEQIDWNPAWSPDGKRIAYVTNRSGDFEHFSIWMLYLK